MFALGNGHELHFNIFSDVGCGMPVLNQVTNQTVIARDTSGASTVTNLGTACSQFRISGPAGFKAAGSLAEGALALRQCSGENSPPKRDLNTGRVYT